MTLNEDGPQGPGRGKGLAEVKQLTGLSFREVKYLTQGHTAQGVTPPLEN